LHYLFNYFNKIIMQKSPPFAFRKKLNALLKKHAISFMIFFVSFASLLLYQYTTTSCQAIPTDENDASTKGVAYVKLELSPILNSQYQSQSLCVNQSVRANGSILDLCSISSELGSSIKIMVTVTGNGGFMESGEVDASALVTVNGQCVIPVVGPLNQTINIQIVLEDRCCSVLRKRMSWESAYNASSLTIPGANLKTKAEVDAGQQPIILTGVLYGTYTIDC
jgi:hypothetical protein